MKRLMIIVFGLLAAANGMAATHYVMTSNPGASDPYTSWTTAGTNIIDVVNAATTNTGTKVVWVTNGTYYLTNEVYVGSALTLQSVNGRDVTIVDGNNYAGKPVTNRCFYLTGSGAVLDGFTITNGYTDSNGGGAYCAAGTTVKNCRITGCVGSKAGDFWIEGAGVYTAGIMTNCEIIGNINYNGAGAIVANGSALVVNCIIASNITYKSIGIGEGHGGGILGVGAGVVISDCKIYGNRLIGADDYHWGNYGAGVFLEGATLRNSLIYGNISTKGGRGGGIAVHASGATIQNCTVVSNTADRTGGGIHLMVPSAQTVYIQNTISYLNTCVNGSNIWNYGLENGLYTGSWQIVYSCIAPTNDFPTSGLPECYYANNIEVDPQFMGKDAGDWRLTKTSPCVNAGTNETWMDGAVDLDGRKRIMKLVVDMGSYEALPPNGTVFYAH